ncbi:MAG: cadmium-translocating P-type ATPase [Oceanospirillaceae bacterium]|nr:cadmium-translocating P-type ATPase [Oceanospirillaceae bacterium]
MNSLPVADNFCFHCLLDIPKQAQHIVFIEGVERQMCCPGCAAVAQTIIDSGLNNYYKHRNIKSATQNSSRERPSLVPQELNLYNSDKVQLQFVTDNEGIKSATLVIEGITCAACIWLLEHHLQQQVGVIKATINMTNHRAQITWHSQQIELSAILACIHHIGYQGHPYRPDVEEQLLAKEQKRSMRRLGIAGVGMMQVLALAVSLYFGNHSGIEPKIENWLRWVSFIICTPIVFYAAQPFFLAAFRDLKARHLSMDVPVSIAIGSAYLASSWATVFSSGEIYFDSVAMFTFFLLFGRYLEMQARHRTGRAGNALQNLLPQGAIKIVDKDGVQFEQLITVSDISVGDTLLVKPGQSIPADGVICSGFSSIDESALTGEYLPKQRSIGQQVIGGTLNVENPIQVKIEKVGAQTQLSAIIRLLERAGEDKPKIAKIADKIASYFVASVLICSLVVALSWWYIDSSQAFWITLSVLVVTCPCALSLATPTALTSATGNLRQRGLLLTRSHVLESLACATDFVFDKTGTLTRGNLTIDNIQGSFDEQQALQIAAALETHSEHPIARAFKPFYQHSASNIEVTLGQGIQGVVANTTYRLGKPIYSRELLKSSTDAQAPTDPGHWLLLCDDTNIIAWFAISDTLRDDSKYCIEQLKKQHIKVHMLTGDSAENAKKIATELGIDHVSADASPSDKIAYINQLQSTGANVVMIGDGINDLPVLAGTQTSIAMGSASDLAKTHADAVLTNAKLGVIIDSLILAKKTRRVIMQNIGWAFSYNMLALPLAAFGLVPPYAAAIGMSLSSLFVVTNALRLSSSKALPNQTNKPVKLSRKSE